MHAQTTIDLRAMSAPDMVADRILDACQQARIVHVRAHPLLAVQRDFWESVVMRHGMQVSVDEDALTGAPTGALWSDVEFDPNLPRVFRHSSAAQPLHTDGSYINDPPQIVFLICQAAAKTGGATVFVDGLDLIDTLARQAPEMLDELLSTSWRFCKGSSLVEAPFLRIDADELTLRWNYYALDKNQSSELQTLATRLQTFLRQLSQQPCLRRVLLQPGEAVFFSDSQVLHGRESFSAQQRGDRCLWKGGLAPDRALSLRRRA